MGETYQYIHTVTIGETNVFKNVYFDTIIKLQGTVRELWVKDNVENLKATLDSGLILITKTVHCDYKKDFFLYDEILCEMQISELKTALAKITFNFFHNQTRKSHAEGWQIILFADKNHKVCRMPENFHKAAKKYLVTYQMMEQSCL